MEGEVDSTERDTEFTRILGRIKMTSVEIKKQNDKIREMKDRLWLLPKAEKNEELNEEEFLSSEKGLIDKAHKMLHIIYRDLCELSENIEYIDSRML